MSAQESADGDADSKPRMPPTPLDKNYDDMTARELRGSIAREVGKNANWDSALTKDTLNSVYAALTGEYFVPKRDLNRPDAPDYHPRKTILRGVVYEAQIGTPVDGWSVGDGQPSQLRRDELQALREEMADRGNQMLEGDADGQQ